MRKWLKSKYEKLIKEVADEVERRRIDKMYRDNQAAFQYEIDHAQDILRENRPTGFKTFDHGDPESDVGPGWKATEQEAREDLAQKHVDLGKRIDDHRTLIDEQQRKIEEVDLGSYEPTPGQIDDLVSSRRRLYDDRYREQDRQNSPAWEALLRRRNKDKIQRMSDTPERFSRAFPGVDPVAAKSALDDLSRTAREARENRGTKDSPPSSP